MLYGLIGKPISHSKSAELFNLRFRKLHSYNLFELEHIEDLFDLINNNEDLAGLNVTIPYKKSIINFIHEIDSSAKVVGAVNTITIERNGGDLFLKGYNTDYIGFEKAYISILSQKHTYALILGTGGASMAVAYVLKKYGIPFYFVSRNVRTESTILYNDLNCINKKVSLIVNTTPVGMYPNVHEKIDIPETIFNENTPTYIDLIYNPLKTSTMYLFEKNNCPIYNGMKMLRMQAEETWRLWKLS